jgi:uncharacterized SAM-binding protein YcdF (DUF218 family)
MGEIAGIFCNFYRVFLLFLPLAATERRFPRDGLASQMRSTSCPVFRVERVRTRSQPMVFLKLNDSGATENLASPTQQSFPQQSFKDRVKQSLPLLLCGLLVLTGLTYYSLPLLGHWLVREDPIRPADAIAVLSGSFPQRAIEAADLYRDGYAPKIWLTLPAKQASGGHTWPLQYRGELANNLQLLQVLGVPQDAIHVLNTPIVNTADELNAIAKGVKQTGDSSVIIVTNKAHTRRVHSLWDKYHFGDADVLVHAVSGDTFSPSRWWKNPSSRAQVIHEFLGMLDLWAGLPVHRPLQSNGAAS